MSRRTVSEMGHRWRVLVVDRSCRTPDEDDGDDNGGDDEGEGGECE